MIVPQQQQPPSPSQIHAPIQQNPIAITREPFEKAYKVGHVLGKGGFGIVYAGIRNRDGLQVAIKHIAKAKIKDWGQVNHHFIVFYNREICEYWFLFCWVCANQGKKVKNMKLFFDKVWETSGNFFQYFGFFNFSNKVVWQATLVKHKPFVLATLCCISSVQLNCNLLPLVSNYQLCCLLYLLALATLQDCFQSLVSHDLHSLINKKVTKR